MKSNETFVILRRTIFNGTVIEDARFISTVPGYEQATEIASLLEDDTRRIIHSLVGFGFTFYVRTYEG